MKLNRHKLQILQILTQKSHRMTLFSRKRKIRIRKLKDNLMLIITNPNKIRKKKTMTMTNMKITMMLMMNLRKIMTMMMITIRLLLKIPQIIQHQSTREQKNNQQIAILLMRISLKQKTCKQMIQTILLKQLLKKNLLQTLQKCLMIHYQRTKTKLLWKNLLKI